MANAKCLFCGTDGRYLRRVRIALRTSDGDYSFCYTCVSRMTADQFWRSFFKIQGLAFRPELTAQEIREFSPGLNP